MLRASHNATSAEISRPAAISATERRIAALSVSNTSSKDCSTNTFQPRGSIEA